MKHVFMCIEVFLVMLYGNIHLFQRTSLQMPKDRERVMCKFKMKRTVTQVYTQGCEMYSCSQIDTFHSLFGLGKIMFSL